MEEPAISSRHNPRLKQAAKLRESRERRTMGRLLVDGARETLRAIEAGVEPVEVFLDISDNCHRTHQALEVIRQHQVPIHTTSPEAFEKLAFGSRTDGLVMVAQAKVVQLEQLELPESPLIAVIESVEKPGNLGAILRTADGAGVDAVLVADPRVDLFNPNVIRASVGAVFRKNVAVCSTEQAIAWLLQCGVSLYATRPEATQNYSDADFCGASAIVLGSEAEGLSTEWDRAQIEAIALPMHGVADSLNVSAAAAVLLYEARRQRGAG